MSIINEVLFWIEAARMEESQVLKQLGFEPVEEPELTLWVHEPWCLIEKQSELIAIIDEVARVASQIKTGKKYLHIALSEMAKGDAPLCLSPSELQRLGEAGCILEIAV